MVVDETQLHYDPMGLTRSLQRTFILPEAAGRSDCDTSHLIIMRQIVGLDGAQLSYAIGEQQCIEMLWTVEPTDRLPAALVGAGWLAIDQISHARKMIQARLACRDEL